MPTYSAISFQDSSSPLMEHLLFFHDHAMCVLILVTILTTYLTIALVQSKKSNKYISEGQEIETIWTITPCLLLIFIALPSLKVLYLMEDTINPSLTVKAVGHQWYWSYEYPHLSNCELEAFMEKSNTLRLLKTNEMLYMPVNLMTRFMITSSDVIHSWTVPSMGVKADAIPGRLNQVSILSKRVGMFAGQCSEICGTNHSFMPILVMSMTSMEFVKKISMMSQK